MYEERKHEIQKEREQMLREAIRKSQRDAVELIYQNLLQDIELFEKLKIDLNDKDQINRFVEARILSGYFEIHWFFKKIKEDKKHRQIVLDRIELIKARNEFVKLMVSCSKFPKWLRIRIHKKRIKYLAERIMEYMRKTNDPTIYSGAWEITTSKLKDHLCKFGVEINGIDQTE